MPPLASAVFGDGTVLDGVVVPARPATVGGRTEPFMLGMWIGSPAFLSGWASGPWLRSAISLASAGGSGSLMGRSFSRCE